MVEEKNEIEIIMRDKRIIDVSIITALMSFVYFQDEAKSSLFIC